MHIKSKLFLLLFLVVGTSVMQAQSFDSSALLQDLTIEDCVLASGACLGAYCFYKVFTCAFDKMYEFYTLVQQERERHKIKKERRKKLYNRVTILFGTTGGQVLDTFYDAKKQITNKVVTKLIASKVASLLV